MELDGLPPIGGLVESSLTHWEGRVVAVVYLQGCNLACPACPVPHLVPRVAGSLPAGAQPEAAGDGGEEGAPEGGPGRAAEASSGGLIPAEGIRDAVFSRRQLLDGVVVAGGEPTLHETLADLLEILRSFGLETRVHTNGTRPRALRRLLESGVVDSVALTLRAPLGPLYSVAAGKDVDLGGIYRSVELLLGDPGGHEFRISVDPRLVTREDVLKLGRTVSGARRVVLEPAAPGLPGARTLRGLARLMGPFARSVTVAGHPGKDYGRVRGEPGDRARGAA
jgi:pyruvate formate lyase activating enzyme